MSIAAIAETGLQKARAVSCQILGHDWNYLVPAPMSASQSFHYSKDELASICLRCHEKTPPSVRKPHKSVRDTAIFQWIADLDGTDVFFGIVMSIIASVFVAFMCWVISHTSASEHRLGDADVVAIADGGKTVTVAVDGFAYDVSCTPLEVCSRFVVPSKAHVEYHWSYDHALQVDRLWGPPTP